MQQLLRYDGTIMTKCDVVNVQQFCLLLSVKEVLEET